MNSQLLILFFIPFIVFSQNFYIKPVHFFDYIIQNHHNKLYFFLSDTDFEDLQFYAYQNDSLIPLKYPIILSNQNPLDIYLVVNNSDNQTISFNSIYFDPQFFITDSFQVYQKYLLHNKNYQINTGYKEIKIYKKAIQNSLPPHIFYKNKSKFEYVEKTCSLDFAKIKPNDLISIHTIDDSIFIPVFNEYYPELKLSDSLETMIYLLTKSEFKFLKKVNKKSYLNFVWSGFDEENKMELKKLYFQRVYEANLYFHEDIEGWRTEKGMIYIIFGKPSSIIIYDGYEDWFYERTQLNNQPVYFRFKVQKSNSKKNKYILERKPEYFDIWNDAIDAWRHGLVLKEK